MPFNFDLSYVRNDPVNLVDPDGNVWKWISKAGEWIAKNTGYPEGVSNDYSDWLLPLEQLRKTNPQKDRWAEQKEVISNAADRFFNRLTSDDKCADLFGGLSAIEVFKSMRESGFFRLNINGSMPSKSSDGKWDAKGGNQFGQFIYLNLRGPFFNPINTFVLGDSKPTHNFLADWQSQYNMPNMDVNMFQEIMIGHEFGHRMGVIETNDAGDDEKQERNTGKIIDACFK